MVAFHLHVVHVRVPAACSFAVTCASGIGGWLSMEDCAITGALKTNKPAHKALAKVHVWRFMELSRRRGDGPEAPGHRPCAAVPARAFAPAVFAPSEPRRIGSNTPGKRLCRAGTGRFDQPGSDAVASATHRWYQLRGRFLAGYVERARQPLRGATDTGDSP